MEVRVLKPPTVLTTTDRLPVFAKMASREMGQFVLVNYTLKTFQFLLLIVVIGAVVVVTVGCCHFYLVCFNINSVCLFRCFC